ncbi:MAG TPA: AraC family transcriptional regulator [Nevskiaceae bacterium]|nr:AraC family transcriptional regulator [Nevskiaceae bacterium]
MPAVAPHQRPTIAVAYLQLLLEILQERGIAPSKLFAGARVSATLLESPQAKMSAEQWTRLVLCALELTGDPALGYAYGLRMRPTAHGVVGYATLSCASVRQAMEIAVRYFQVRQANFQLSLREDTRGAVIELVDAPRVPVLRTFFVENILLGLARGAAVLIGRELGEVLDLEIAFDWAEPPYHRAWRWRLPRVRFGQAVNALRLPVALLEQRPVLADPLATSQAIELCERELALVDGGEDDDVCARVRAQLRPSLDTGYPQLEAVAGRLHLSGRTLKRKLQAQGTGYLELLEQARRRDAEDLLLHSAMSVHTIAERLGYRNPANFSRAFQRWTGVPPSRWRAQSRTD